MNLILLGPPGAGKGTQAERLRAELDLAYLATGNTLRAAVADQTPLGRQVEELMARGELVPDELVVGVLVDELRRVSPSRGILLDGFPRTVAQAQALTGALDELQRSVTAALLIDTPDEEIVRRISGRRVSLATGRVYHVESDPPKVDGICDVDGSRLVQRDDDTEPVIRRRLAVYREQTGPVVEHYRAHGLLKRFDGRRSPPEVSAAIRAALGLD